MNPYTPPSDFNNEVLQQKTSNKTSLAYFSAFREHRQLLTQKIISLKKSHLGRLCILGAGNCFDIELETLCKNYAEIHLVDIDRAALLRAKNKLPNNLQKKIHLHAPLDISGAGKKLVDWRNGNITPDALIAFPEHAMQLILTKLPAPFDCVVSSCLISQILLMYRQIMGEHHPLFEAGLITLLITHLRIITALTHHQGQSLLVTDISSNDIAPLSDFDAGAEGLNYLEQRIVNNQIFHYLNPELLTVLAQQDPFLAGRANFAMPSKAWLWQNGPAREFLVYASVITPLVEM